MDDASLVVGHDGSPAAARTLDLALDVADRLGAAVTVLRVWNIGSAPPHSLFKEGYVSSFEEVSAEVGTRLEHDTLAARERHPAVEVACHAVHGQPAEALIEASTGATMLVVGSRGRGGFSSLRLGSVSEQCVRHAFCPVLVVRDRARPHTPA
jgi:nucleotide-binding universal stress UspA family protein